MLIILGCKYVCVHGRPIVEKPSCLQTTLASEPLHLLSQMLPQTPSRHTSTLPSISLAPSLSLTCPFTQSLPLALKKKTKSTSHHVNSLLHICSILYVCDTFFSWPMAACNPHIWEKVYMYINCFPLRTIVYQVIFVKLLTLTLEILSKGNFWKQGIFAKISSSLI